jgi:hypothetical protein
MRRTDALATGGRAGRDRLVVATSAATTLATPFGYVPWIAEKRLRAASSGES